MTRTLRTRLGAGMLVSWQLACVHVANYLDPLLPRYVTTDGDARDLDPALRVVSFNIEEGRRIGRATLALSTHPELRDADVLVLQEMDARGVAAVAAALRMNSVYYPASRQPRGGPDWGNAILSPWPILDAGKVLLPHRSFPNGRARIAVRATVRLPGGPARVYSVHLDAPLGMTPGRRRDQALAVLADAATSPLPVVVAGDFNSHALGRLFESNGYCWPTKSVGATTHGFSFDHVFVRGRCGSPADWTAGVAREVRDASDHRPVWAALAAAPRPASAPR